ncbi:MAG: transglycosylase domain-containing protein [Candidatus Eisenbacteria bacterium]|nr:transglycosylase domain-containing protein [Candidatus Eisenbacteria bacterium]
MTHDPIATDAPRDDETAPAAPIEATQSLTRRFPAWLIPAVLALVLVAFLIWEARTSRVQAAVLSRMTAKLTYAMALGPTDSVIYPTTGPYDLRRGYTKIPSFTDTLLTQGYVVTGQARFSQDLLKFTNAGLFPIYHEKAQAGLLVYDRGRRRIYGSSYPERLYADFGAIPDLVVQSLLFIENRELLEPGRPFKNPAVEWDRLVRAVFDYVGHKFRLKEESPGGSTLATQMEKYRHSPEGRTSSANDKIIQMISATLRAYLDGPNTEASRRDIVHEFVNSVPLAALPGYGEVNGLGDGLWAWYGADFETVNRLLTGLSSGTPVTAESARAFKQVLSLFIAHRRPSYYLIQNRERLAHDTDSYIRLLASGQLVPADLLQAALKAPLKFREETPDLESHTWVQRKAANAVRTRLLQLLNLKNLYDLDRVDLTAATTLDAGVQEGVTRTLIRLTDAAFADSANLRGERLLASGDPKGVIYSFTLYEKSPRGNRLVVQADNYDQPLDINEGAKLDLGSTAKLRTLVNYLDIVSQIHADHAGTTATRLRRVTVDKQDAIQRWAIDWLATAGDTSLAAMLDAAMNRTYSSSTGEQFFTSGGLLTFGNFNKSDNGKTMTLREATRHSVNLVYIRLMRDIVRHYTSEIPDFTSDMYEERTHPARRRYLERFADREGKQFLAKFLPRYRGKTPEEILDRMVEEIRPTATRMAMIFRAVKPEAPVSDFRAWVLRTWPEGLATARGETALRDAFQRYPKTAFDIHDRGYIARVHPLELWLVEYLYNNPAAGWTDLVAASTQERQDVYKWLFNSKSLEGQNNRIRVLVEEEAFQKVHLAWKRQGYPFSSLVPSYATSIGSSADRPAALTELMGILVNDGLRLPLTRIEAMHLAAGTPYEIRYEQRPVTGERVYPAELARVVRTALFDVVENGTARRAYGAFKTKDGEIIPVGGKTGTGDHRYDTYAPGGRLIESRVVNRTATFVFLIGDRFFGTLTAYVAGPKAAGYAFTSSLPVQILKTLAPALEPLITAGSGDSTGTGDPEAAGSSQAIHLVPPIDEAGE